MNSNTNNSGRTKAVARTLALSSLAVGFTFGAAGMASAEVNTSAECNQMWADGYADGYLDDAEFDAIVQAGCDDMGGDETDSVESSEPEVSEPTPAPESMSTRDAWVAAYADGTISSEEWAQLVINGHTYTYARSDNQAALSDAAWAWAMIDGAISDTDWNDLRNAGFADIRGLI